MSQRVEATEAALVAKALEVQMALRETLQLRRGANEGTMFSGTQDPDMPEDLQLRSLQMLQIQENQRTIELQAQLDKARSAARLALAEGQQ